MLNRTITNLFIIFILIRVKTIEGYTQVNSLDEKEYQHCMCVPFWQCKKDYSGLIDDGIDIIDIRKEFRPNGGKTIPCTGEFDVCCQVECGKRRTIISEVIDNRVFLLDEDTFGYRILGENNEADFAEFPWMLGILEKRTYRCGASLIHPQVALTAAHCVTGKGPFIIRAGEWNWAKDTEPVPHQDRMAKKVIIHPQYHAASLRNDIALLIAESPFNLTRNVGLACLPVQGHQVDNKRCIATGWGKNSHMQGTYQTTLKKLELPLVPTDKCLQSLRKARLGPFFNLHRSFICAGGEANKDTCKGDGGSPLICPVVGQPERYEQVGIVSWGLTCGIQNTPGVYVNIDLFRNWINDAIESQDFYTNVYKY